MHLKVFTETALALAMACCALLVLVMLSYGLGCHATAEPEMGFTPTDAFTLHLPKQPSSPDVNKGANKSIASVTIFYRDRFFDPALRPIASEDLAAAIAGPGHLLAVEPALPVSEILRLRARLADKAVHIIPLTPAWLQVLERQASPATPTKARAAL